MTERTCRQIIEGQQPVTAPPTITVTEAARLMKEHNIGALMVCEGVKLVGVFTERDALFRIVAAGMQGTTPLSEVMTANPQTIPADSGFSTALHIMHDGHFRHLPVVDGERLVGVVSVRDALGPELESFVFETLRQEQVQEVRA